jgi:deoxyribonuclease II
MLSALDEDGKPVDWWFLYKLPKDAPLSPGAPAGDAARTSGYEYLYYDPAHPALALSSHTLEDGTGALHQTLAGFFGSAVGGPPAADVPFTTGWVLYNDEIPGASVNNGARGHTKGVLAFDTASDSALWLLHSTPRFPHPRDVRFPVDEVIYGQTMLCVTLPSVAAAEAIAAQMLDEQEPQTYSPFIPDAITATSPLRELAGMPRVPDSKDPQTVPFTSRGGRAFECIAKSRNWGLDYWNDLVGPELGVNLDVETWRRGVLPSTADSDKTHNVTDVLSVDLAPLGVPYTWSYTQDHAKWAVSTDPSWVCVGDINRQVSQEKRGGGSICFQEEPLWKALASVQTERVEKG